MASPEYTNKIRKRKSYQMFKEIKEAFDIDAETGLETLYLKLDNMQAFGSRTMSGYARESLQIFKEDLNKVLSERTKELILRGGKMEGSFKGGIHYIMEDLYTNEVDEVMKFCAYLDDEIGGAGRANIDILYTAFSQPNNQEAQEKANEVKQMIASFKVK